jgi:hypothetical protein
MCKSLATTGHDKRRRIWYEDDFATMLPPPLQVNAPLEAYPEWAVNPLSQRRRGNAEASATRVYRSLTTTLWNRGWTYGDIDVLCREVALNCLRQLPEQGRLVWPLEVRRVHEQGP